jgi:hypothetical protein
MPHSFQRVNQSLRADHAIRSNAVIITAIFLLTAWFVWAFRATLPLYQVSTSAHVLPAVANAIQISAEFSASAVADLRPGQPALFRAAALSGSFPARVTQIASELRNGKLQVELALEPLQSRTISLTQGLPGTAQVEVARITPAALLFHSAGELVGRD